MIPQLKWEIDVRCAESTDEVVFEGLDGTFRGVDVVIMRFYELYFDVVVSSKFFDFCGRLVVSDVEVRCVSICPEGVDNCGEGGDDVFASGGCNGDGKDVIGVIVIRYEE